VSAARALGRDVFAAFDGAGVPYEPPREAAYTDSDVGRALLTTLRFAGSQDDFIAPRTLVTSVTGGSVVGRRRQSPNHLGLIDLNGTGVPPRAFQPRHRAR
jgi:hypothetical protein